MNKTEYNKAFDAGFSFAVNEIQNVAAGSNKQAFQVLRDLILHLTMQNPSNELVEPQIQGEANDPLPKSI